MRCIFCKTTSTNSKSVEHVIPESLGNKEHVLKKGVVCDKCNQYFAIKVEKAVLDTPYFKHVRHRNNIESKKRNIPKINGIIGGKVELGRDRYGNTFIEVPNQKILNGITSGKITTMIVPKIDDPEPDDKNMSRFLAKIAIEMLALRFFPSEGWNEEVVDKEELDSIRHYARFGDKPEFWEYNQRRIYEESDRFYNPQISNEPYEVLHEIDIKFLRDGQLFLILVIMGIEYVLNFTNPDISEYRKWLIENGQKSPIEINDNRKLIKTNDDYQWVGQKMNFFKREE
jgi:hypothetical protein